MFLSSVRSRFGFEWTARSVLLWPRAPLLWPRGHKRAPLGPFHILTCSTSSPGGNLGESAVPHQRHARALFPCSEPAALCALSNLRPKRIGSGASTHQSTHCVLACRSGRLYAMLARLAALMPCRLHPSRLSCVLLPSHTQDPLGHLQLSTF